MFAADRVGTYFFLRLWSPIIINPAYIGIIKGENCASLCMLMLLVLEELPPDSIAKRGLTQIAKVIQTLANGEKEMRDNNLQSLSPFLVNNSTKIKSFYSQ